MITAPDMEILEKLGLTKRELTNNYSVDKNYHEAFKYEFMPTFDIETEGTIEMIDEIWINAKFAKGRVTITGDIWILCS